LPKCEFSEKCISRGKCNSCARNEEQDYYIPKQPPYWIGDYPWWQKPGYYVTVTTSNGQKTLDYYKSKV
jgi:hypothetical protein